MLKTVAEILKMKPEDFVQHQNTPCCKCQTPLRASINGCRDTRDGPMCDDCYFKIMSDHLDNHPITPPPYIE